MVLVANVLCSGRIFRVYYGFLPVIYSLAFVHQSSMFRVVDVLRAVSYTVAENKCIFFFSVTNFFLYVMFYVRAVF